MLYKKKNDHLHSSFEDFHDNVVIFLKSQKSFKAQSQRESYSSFFTIMQSKTRFQFSFHLWHVEERWKCTEFLDREHRYFQKNETSKCWDSKSDALSQIKLFCMTFHILNALLNLLFATNICKEI